MTAIGAGRLRIRPITLLVVALSCGPASAVRGTDTGHLQDVARPELSQLEQAVQERLLQARRELDAALADPGSSATVLGESFGRMGKLYYVHDLVDLAEVCFRNAATLQPGDAQWPHYLGVLAILEGRLQEAEQSFRRVLELAPGNAPALTRLGNVQLELDDLAGAEESYRQALTVGPQNAAALYGIGRIEWLRKSYPAAIESFQAALALQPEADSIHHSLGLAYRELGDRGLARQHLAMNRGGRVRVDDPLIADLGALLESSQRYFKAGVDAMRREDYQTALHQLTIARDLDPDDFLIPYNMALALLRSGREDEAIRWLRTSVEIDPDFRNGHFNLATLLASRGQMREAAQHFAEAHRIDPEDAETHREWATALSLLGEPERAIEELQGLLEIHPGDTPALLNLGILLVQSGRIEEAIVVFTRLADAAEDPAGQLEARLRLGTLEAERGRGEAALEHYRAALELDERSVPARLGMAGALGRAGDYTAAAREFGRIIELDPERWEAHFGRAMALVLSENYSRALAALDQSVAAANAPLALQHLLAQLLAACPDPSVRDGERALQLAQAVFQQQQSLEHAETVAMALAELGRFEEAVELQSRVVAEAEGRALGEVAARGRARLERYRRGEQVRAPWHGG